MSTQGKILIVDDELGPRESLRMILKPIFETHTASNGQEALDFIRRERVDLVTLDLKMPGMPGLDVLREIKSQKSDIEVIIITGYGTLSNAVEAIRYGAVDFVSKPFNVSEIISIVNKSLERRHWNVKIHKLIQKVKDLHCRGASQEQLPEGGSGESSELQLELKETFNRLEALPGPKAYIQAVDFLKVLISILESRDPSTNGHAERVAHYSGIIANDLYLSPREKENLQIATLLHDIGKVGLERRMIKRIGQHPYEHLSQHPVQGVYLVEPLALPQSITSAIRHHHERWDGRGYPDGLSGEAIPLLARVIAVADSYDCITSARSNRPGFSSEKAREEMERNAGTRLDPHLVSVFSKNHLAPGKGPCAPCPEVIH